MAESDIRWVFLEEQFVGGLREGGTKQALSAGKASSLFLVTQSCVCVCVCVWRERERERERDGLTLSAPQSAAINNGGAVHSSQVFFFRPYFTNRLLQQVQRRYVFLPYLSLPCCSSGPPGSSFSPPKPAYSCPILTGECGILPHVEAHHMGESVWQPHCRPPPATSTTPHWPSLHLASISHCCRSGSVVLTFGCPLSIVPHCPPSNRTPTFFRHPKHLHTAQEFPGKMAPSPRFSVKEQAMVGLNAFQ